MSKTLFLIFNHDLTDHQRRDAEKNLGAGPIVDLPEHLKTLWRQIPPDVENIDLTVVPVIEWLKVNSRPGDYVLIQGDFGAVYQLVNAAFDHGLIPVYSTTIRQAEERHGKDGSVELTHFFRHVRFREYKR